MASICPSCGGKNIEGADECADCGADLRTTDLPKPASKIEQAVMNLPLTTLDISAMRAVPPTSTLQEAVETLSRENLSILAVVENEKLVGVLSVRDVMMRVGIDYEQKRTTPVRDVMTKSPETLPPDAPITFAINTMDVGGYRHVPVVQDDHLVGVVSGHDVLRYLLRHDGDSVAPSGHTTSHGRTRPNPPPRAVTDA